MTTEKFDALGAYACELHGGIFDDRPEVPQPNSSTWPPIQSSDA